jgi:basic membrane protein A
VKRIRGFLFLFVFSFIFAGCGKGNAAWTPGKPLDKGLIKVGVIHPNEISETSLFDWVHYAGTVEMQKNLGLDDRQIIRRVNVFEENPQEVEAVIRECISEGVNVIIAPSFNYMDVCDKLSREFPQVVFANATGYKYNDLNFTNYSGRLYQARYLSGIAAGLKTGTNKIGFVAAMGKNNSEVSGGINAFALGVESVNPGAEIFVKVTYSWFDPMGEAEAAKALIGLGCDVIAQHCNTAAPQTAAQDAGVWGIGFNGDMSVYAPEAVITSVVLRWGVYYSYLVQSVIDGSFTTLPYFGGVAEGMVDITELSPALAAPGTESAVAEARRRITEEGFNVFDGEMRTNDGKIIGVKGSTLSDAEIIGGIDWYYHTIIEP